MDPVHSAVTELIGSAPLAGVLFYVWQKEFKRSDALLASLQQTLADLSNEMRDNTRMMARMLERTNVIAETASQRPPPLPLKEVKR